ncbi:Hypothetical predicted protein [Scomber scombrus]|uniref:Uncharacterized protein n=1 Tax=Scomber scombrus TaxID=13677 RepID=A0AAV1P138_SCOSC
MKCSFDRTESHQNLRAELLLLSQHWMWKTGYLLHRHRFRTSLKTLLNLPPSFRLHPSAPFPVLNGLINSLMTTLFSFALDISQLMLLKQLGLTSSEQYDHGEATKYESDS